LARPKTFAFRKWSLSSPCAVEDAGACCVAYFGESLHLEEQATQIQLFDGSVFEVVRENVFHENSVVGAKKAR
jgi:hypothetical protein